MSLQFISANSLLLNLFEIFPINLETKQPLEEYIKKYVTQNPQFLTSCLRKTRLYNVYFRECDPYCCGKSVEFDNFYDENSLDSTIHYLASFVTEKEASKWVLDFGRKIVTYEEDDRNTQIILTIIHSDISPNIECVSGYDYDCGTNLVYCGGISECKYETYAFSKKGYQMVLREHYVNAFTLDEIPYWIKYVDEKNQIIQCKNLDYLGNFTFDIENYLNPGNNI
jgi:hypothetical protein